MSLGQGQGHLMENAKFAIWTSVSLGLTYLRSRSYQGQGHLSSRSFQG